MDIEEAKAKYAKISYEYRKKRQELYKLQDITFKLRKELDVIEELADCNGWNLIQDPVILLQNYENSSYQYHLERENEEKIKAVRHNQDACEYACIDENETFMAGVRGYERAKKEINNA